MHPSKRALALAVAGVLLAACHHKDKNAPLAFVPADTPYVVANLEVIDDDTRSALLTQADAQLPAQLAQMNAAADQLAVRDPDNARLLRAFIAELNGKTIESFAQNAGLDLKGRSALYGLGLAPVLRAQLTDPKAFDGFVGRLETAYGKRLDMATIGGQAYRRHLSPASGIQLVVAVVDRQAVVAILPVDASQALLRQALGLDRPKDNLQDDGRLAKLAKDKDYKTWAVGDFELIRALPLAASGKDPLFNAMFKARATAESASTGEPVANQTHIAPSCESEAQRIATRMPAVSFGYTRLDGKHQEMRWDVSLAQDITQAFAGLKVGLPGLGSDDAAPFDVNLAFPVAQLRTFWTAQADAVAAKPFTCPAFTGLNDVFAKLGLAMQKSATPPFGNVQGLRIAVDNFTPAPGAGMPRFSGRLVVATTDPAGLLAMGQMMTPALARLKVGNDGKPVALPPDIATQFGQPAWMAMNAQALALGVGTGEDAKLASSLKDTTGDAGRMLRMSLDGAMYLNWIDLMQKRLDSLTAATSALAGSASAAAPPDAAAAQTLAQTNAARQAQFQAMRAQAQRIRVIRAQVEVQDQGVVATSQTELK